MVGKSKQACVDCHFLIRHCGPEGPRIVLEERRAIRKHDYSWLGSDFLLGCHFSVWDEPSRSDQETRDQIILETDRRASCFFWKYRPGMLVKAAEVLQNREAERREASRDRRLTCIGLWIAAIALLVGAIPEIIKLLASLCVLLTEHQCPP